LEASRAARASAAAAIWLFPGTKFQRHESVLARLCKAQREADAKIVLARRI